MTLAETGPIARHFWGGVNNIAEQLRRGEQAPTMPVRTFLALFGAQRRGYSIVQRIRSALQEAGLVTVPDFESAYIDSSINFSLASDTSGSAQVGLTGVEAASAAGSVDVAITERLASSTIYADPTYKISKLAAANNNPVAVAPDSTLQQAVTIMLSRDFSQLPVMTNERDVKGVISWISIGTRLALGKGGTSVREMMDDHQEIRADASLFQAIPVIVQYQYVLIRGADKQIAGIVTASDLSLQFQQLAEPFLLLGEIENHVRRILDGKFSVDELRAASNAAGAHRSVTDVADLTFGDYVRLLEDPGRWPQVHLPVDRVAFIAELDKIREIRNDVMHFDPDPLPPDDLARLREFVRFLQRLQGIGAS